MYKLEKGGQGDGIGALCFLALHASDPGLLPGTTAGPLVVPESTKSGVAFEH